MNFFKKWLPVALVLLLAVLILPGKAEAATVDSGTCGENLTWTLDDAGTLTISGTGPMENYADSDDVPWLDNHRTTIKKAVIEDGVTTVSNFAFWCCEKLEEATIGADVTAIGNYAFNGCKKLTTAPLGNKVVTIGKNAFNSCWALEEIRIPDSVTTIGEWAFASCRAAKTATLGKGVQIINTQAFGDCKALESVYIDDLTHWCNIDFTGITGNPMDAAKKLYVNGKLLTDLVIPAGITRIHKYQFFGFECLQTVTIPDHVTHIDNDAFRDSKMTEVHVGKGLTEVALTAFFSCTELKKVFITDLTAWCNINFREPSSNPLYYNADLYLNGAKLTDLVIPETVTEVKSDAFVRCASLRSVTIPGHVKTLGNRAFSGCENITSLKMEEGIETVGGGLFSECTALTSVQLPGTLSMINDDMFRKCTALTTLTFPEGVTLIENYAINGCTNLTKLYLPSTLQVIESAATPGCTNLAHVYFNGTREEWEDVNVKINNDPLAKAKFHFKGEEIPGDMDGDGEKTTNDAVYLLLSVMFGTEDYPVPAGTDLDFNGDNTVDTNDAVYLLLHVMFGAEDYPI